MGRTRIAKARIVELQSRVAFAQRKKTELILYTHKLKEKYLKKQISYSRYVEILYKKADGKTINQWIDYYDDYIKDCEKLIKEQKKKLIITKVPIILLSLGFIIVLITSVFYIQPIIVGFFVQEQEHTQIINMDFNESTIYDWAVENPGTLDSVKISGSVLKQGNAKVYLEDILIFDSSKLKKEKNKPNSLLTGQAISEPDNNEISWWKKILGFFTLAGRAVEDSGDSGSSDSSDNSDSSDSGSDSGGDSGSSDSGSSDSSSESSDSEDTITGGSTAEDSSPSPEESSTTSEEESTEEAQSEEPEEEETEEEPETNITEEEPPTKEPEQNITEEPDTNETTQEPSEEEPEEEPTEDFIINFKDICEETCDLSYILLNKSTYTLRIEISNSELNLDEIKYTILEKIPENITEEIPPENITEKPILPNITIIPKINISENFTIATVQYSAVLGQPVKWKKHLELDKPEKIKIELPKEATKITVNKLVTLYSEDTITGGSTAEDSSPSQEESPTTSEEIKEIEKQISEKEQDEKIQELEEQIKELNEKVEKLEEKEDITSTSLITGQTISEPEKEKSFFLTKWIKNIFSTITGRAITTQEILEKGIIEVTIDENATNFEIKYETPAPYAIEQETSSGKIVKIIGPTSIHYENVLAFTELNENLKVTNPSKIKIYWEEQNTYLPVQSVQDRNNNNIYDYIEWVAPQLSNQTFHIIVITKAEHLNENKIFIEEIYEQVKELDNIWSPTIPDSHYVRVVFETNLSSENDITIYPRIINGTPKIEIYELDGTDIIAEFSSLNSDQYNKIYLTNLISESQNTFDLKILDGAVEFDHIIDPSACSGGWCEFDNTLNLADIYICENGRSGSCATTTDMGIQIKWDISDLCDLNPDSIDSANLQLNITSKAGSPDNDATIFYIEDQTWTEASGELVVAGQSAINQTAGTFSSITSGKLTNVSVLTQLKQACGQGDNVTIRIYDPDYEVTAINAVGDGAFNNFGHTELGSDNYYAFGARENTDSTAYPKLLIEYTGGAAQNNVPTQTTPIIIPSAVRVVDNMTCVNQSTADLDGETVTNIYNWLVDGSSIAILNMPFNSEITATTENLIRDYSNWKNNATLASGSATPTWTSNGKLGGGYIFDGKDDYMDISTINNLANTESITIMAWIKPNGFSKYDWIFTAGRTGDNPIVTMTINETGLLQGHIEADSTDQITTTEDGLTMSSGNWYHVAIVYDRINNQSIRYINGTQTGTIDDISSTMGTLSVEGTSYIAAASNLQANEHFNGTIDEVKVYNRTISAIQIKKIYNEGFNNYTNSTILSNELTAGENWTCQVIPNDGKDDGLISQNSTIILSSSGCIPIESGITLSADTSHCYEFTQDDTTLDCAGHTITGTKNNTLYYINANNTKGITIKDCLLQNASHGIKFKDVNNSKIINTTLYNFNDTSGLEVYGIGINFTNSYNNLIQVNLTNIYTGQTTSEDCFDNSHLYGIYLFNSNNITIENSTFNNINGTYRGDTSDSAGCQSGILSHGTAIYAENSNNLTIYNSNLSSGKFGITISNGIDLNISSNKINNITSRFAHISSNSKNIFIINNQINQSSRAIIILNSNNSLIKNNFISQANTRNIYFSSSQDYIIQDNKVKHGLADLDASSLIQTTGGNNGTIKNNVFEHFNLSSNTAFYIANGLNLGDTNTILKNNTFFNITFPYDNGGVVYVNNQINSSNNNFTNITKAYYFNGLASSNSTIINDTITFSNNSIYLEASANNISFVNVNFNKSNCEFEALTSFFNYYYLKVNVTNNTLQSISGASVNISDALGVRSVSDTTDADGLTSQYTFLEYNETSNGKTYFTNYNVSGNESNYATNSTLVNLTSSKFVHLILPSNTAPEVIYMSPIAATNPVEAGYKIIKFNVTINDTDGVNNLNDSSVTANFSKTDEALRENISCVETLGANTSSAQNYSCTIAMWYFDGSGNWNVTVYGEDTSGGSGINTSTSFQYNQLKALIISPSGIGFNVERGQTNQTANTGISINNTGNYNATGNIGIEAIDLYGKGNADGYVISCGNFTADTDSGETSCAGVVLQNATNVTITSSVLERGNLSDAKAQETIYYCMKTVPSIIVSGVYDTSTAGSWTITLLLVALIPARRKKNIKNNKSIKALDLLTQELREEYSKDKEAIIKALIKEIKKKHRISNKEIYELLEVRKDIEIPLNIFTKELGALESITKYMKENLSMAYYEIAELLNRDQRTIWTAYNKANKKQNKGYKTKNKKMKLPIQIFDNKKLTILETVIAYLRQENLSYSEIAKLINRDQRNIWKTYSKIKK